MMRSTEDATMMEQMTEGKANVVKMLWYPLSHKARPRPPPMSMADMVKTSCIRSVTLQSVVLTEDHCQ